MSRPPPGLAKFDSSSAMVQALARFLHGRGFPALGQSRWLELPVSLANWVPRTLRERAFALFGAMEGVPPEHVARMDMEQTAAWAAGLFPARRYPAVMIGASSGALVHLGAALGVPWLPQTFLGLVRLRSIHPDDAAGAMQAALAPARRFLDANPGVQLHHMHDPAQDRLMLDYVAYFRSKFLRLPDAYRDFIARALEPGGTIVITDCGRRWPTRRLGDRSFFQFGAVGGPTVGEYFEGSERVEAYLARYRSPWQRWQPPAPDGESPEAEWGFEPALEDDIAALARERGYRIVRLRFDEPEALSPMVADFYRDWYRAIGIPATRLVVGSFILLEPYWTLRAGAVPYWMTFNMRPSLDALRAYLDGASPFEHIHLTLFAHGVDSVGLPPIAEWKSVLACARKGGSFLGVDEGAYPAHFATFARYYPALRRIPAPHALPSAPPLQAFERFVGRVGERYNCAIEPRATSHDGA